MSDTNIGCKVRGYTKQELVLVSIPPNEPLPEWLEEHFLGYLLKIENLKNRKQRKYAVNEGKRTPQKSGTILLDGFGTIANRGQNMVKFKLGLTKIRVMG